MLGKDLLPRSSADWNGLKIYIPYADLTMFPIQIYLQKTSGIIIPAIEIDPPITQSGESRLISQDFLDTKAIYDEIYLQVSNSLVSVNSELNQNAINAGMSIENSWSLQLKTGAPYSGSIGSCLWTVYIDIGG